jgi:hypothetical protein
VRSAEFAFFFAEDADFSRIFLRFSACIPSVFSAIKDKSGCPSDSSKIIHTDELRLPKSSPKLSFQFNLTTRTPSALLPRKGIISPESLLQPLCLVP